MERTILVQPNNLREPHVESTKIMAYMEKHEIPEIIRRLVAELSYSRVINVESYVHGNIRNIASQVQTQRLCLLTPPSFDNKQLAKTLWKSFNIPVIVYTRKRMGCDGDVVLHKFKKFLKTNGLDDKNLIFFNFPDCRVECLQFHHARMDPTNVVEIVPSFQAPFKTRAMLEDEDARHVWKFDQVASYHKEVFHKMVFGFAENDSAGQSRNRCTFKEVSMDLIEMMRHQDMKVDAATLGGFLPRVLIIGRKCSGRKTQALALAKRFNLVFINFKQLLLEHARTVKPFGNALNIAIKTHDYSDCLIAAILYERVIQKDCLQRGWVAIDYPHDVQGLANISKFIVQPNKIVFLHCRERVVKRRMEKMLRNIFTKLPCSECDPELCSENVETIAAIKAAAEQELAYFNLHKKSMLQYLSNFKGVIHIDGNHSVDTVKTNIWSRLNQQQNIVGLQTMPCIDRHVLDNLNINKTD